MSAWDIDLDLFGGDESDVERFSIRSGRLVVRRDGIEYVLKLDEDGSISFSNSNGVTVDVEREKS